MFKYTKNALEILTLKLILNYLGFPYKDHIIHIQTYMYAHILKLFENTISK